MRYFSALAFVVCLLVPSIIEAQVVTHVATLSQTFREGTTTTNSVAVPADAVFTEVHVVFNIQTGTYEDVTTRLAARLYRLLPATQTWQMMMACTFSGGRYVDEDGIVNPPITCSADASVLKGYTIRAEVETNARIRLGADVYTYQP